MAIRNSHSDALTLTLTHSEAVTGGAKSCGTVLAAVTHHHHRAHNNKIARPSQPGGPSAMALSGGQTTSRLSPARTPRGTLSQQRCHAHTLSHQTPAAAEARKLYRNTPARVQTWDITRQAHGKREDDMGRPALHASLSAACCSCHVQQQKHCSAVCWLVHTHRYIHTHAYYQSKTATRCEAASQRRQLRQDTPAGAGATLRVPRRTHLAAPGGWLSGGAAARPTALALSERAPAAFRWIS